MINSVICEKVGIKYPVQKYGMDFRRRLAAAVSNVRDLDYIRNERKRDYLRPIAGHGHY